MIELEHARSASQSQQGTMSEASSAASAAQPPSRKTPSYADQYLGENDGISTVVRQDSRTGVLAGIPSAENRIFLGQKQGVYFLCDCSY